MDIISLIKAFGYAGVWSALFIEGAFIFGIFLPGDSLLFPVGILIGQGVFDLQIMIIGCFISAFLGNLAGYEIGKRWGPALVKKYGDRWKLMHLKDLRKGVKKDLTGNTSQENDVPLGTGELDIPGILKQAKKVGIKHYFIEDESSHVNTQVPQSITYLKSLKK